MARKATFGELRVGRKEPQDSLFIPEELVDGQLFLTPPCSVLLHVSNAARTREHPWHLRSSTVRPECGELSF